MNRNQKLKDVWKRKKTSLRLTQEKAAEVLGYEHQATVSQILNGKLALSFENTIKMAELLQVAPEEISSEHLDMIQYIRNTGTPDFNSENSAWVKVEADEKELLNLYKRLPSDEKELTVKDLRHVTAKYDKLFEELSALRKK
ncbi:helix-turn-helix domain-containing protein [Kosakonia sacchari]|uniref:helix-turn-helix domain-containing protein n=1 Tax=Enterobacteriaceae TaxID=543 RepID=UPI000F830EA3|nr:MULTISPECIES: helix-turn-helix domain-containing protein [Enterobacteriaceae]MDZ7320720.1 helix-turn-helix domain-containing protein [Kosakonia sacchari]RTQ01271.1 helix-turn-helix domain-containing protein [Enterobacter sp. WCHEn045836]